MKLEMNDLRSAMICAFFINFIVFFIALFKLKESLDVEGAAGNKITNLNI